MSAATPSTQSAPDLVGGFTAKAFSRHLSGLSSAPLWWLERKRAAYALFESLQLPGRTDEGWRFSNISGVALGGYSPAQGKTQSAPKEPETLAVEAAGSLWFADGQLAGSVAISEELRKKGVIVTTLLEALSKHPELLREHFMAQPQKLGSAKFAALHEAFVLDGAFVHVPRGVEVDKPFIVVHSV